MKRQYEDKIQNWINTVQYQGRNFKDDADMPVFRNSNAAFFYCRWSEKLNFTSKTKILKWKLEVQKLLKFSTDRKIGKSNREFIFKSDMTVSVSVIMSLPP